MAVVVGQVYAAANVTRACRSVADVVPTGVTDVPATRIRATGVTCVLARSLPRRVILNVRYGAINPARYGKQALGIARWAWFRRADGLRVGHRPRELDRHAGAPTMAITAATWHARRLQDAGGTEG
jgi:hypothetical protein